VPFYSTVLWCNIYNLYSTYNRACTREEGRKVEREREKEREREREIGNEKGKTR